MKPRPTATKKKERVCISCGCVESSHSKPLIGDPSGPRVYCVAIEDRNHPCKGRYEDSKHVPEVPTRTVFVKDPGRSIEGFVTFEDADVERRKLGKDTDERRTRVRFRRRTDRWDMLVKVAKRVPIEEPKAIGE